MMFALVGVEEGQRLRRRLVGAGGQGGVELDINILNSQRMRYKHL